MTQPLDDQLAAATRLHQAAKAHCNLGIKLASQGKLAEAIACYQQAIELKPDYAEAYFGLGSVFKEQGRLEEAIESFARSLELQPVNIKAIYNLACFATLSGLFDRAADLYLRVLHHDPQFAPAHCNLSQLRLLHGDFDSGWPEYEWRWAGSDPTRQLGCPRWNGEPLIGKSILLWSEQGLGDTLQFVRFALVVKNLGARVVLECQRPLLKLLDRCPFVDRLTAPGDELPQSDFHAPLLSLPGILRATLETIPAPIPYLVADPALVEEWRERLKPCSDFKIGISWHGSTETGEHSTRNIPLDCFATLSDIPQVRLISLQKEDANERRPSDPSPPGNAAANDHPWLIDLRDQIDTVHGAFMDTAAIMQHLDLVITSDTAIAHLAGALGVPAWLALPSIPNWRWLLHRTDSPWYPTLRLFRQTTPGDWSTLFKEIRTALLHR